MTEVDKNENALPGRGAHGSGQNPLSAATPRRSALRMLGAAGAGAGVFTAAATGGTAHAASGPLPGMSSVFDVTAYGAVGDGAADDSTPIQKAINVASAKGGVVWIPPGAYRLGTGLTVNAPIVIAGAGWGPAQNTHGSWLYVDSTNVSAITITWNGAGTTVADLAIGHKQPSPGPGWAPLDYPPAIQVSSTDVHIHDVMLNNPTRGISITYPDGVVGRVCLERIWGQPLRQGIEIDNALDVIKIDNIHFWPFWSVDPNVGAYVAGNATAIRSARNDNPHFTRIFALGYAVGMHFDASSGITSKFRLSDADFDICGYGVRITGNGTTGQITNLTSQGAQDAKGNITGVACLDIEADGVTVQATNVRASYFTTNGVRVHGAGTNLFLENCWVENWNISGRGFPGIEAVAPASVYVGRGRFFKNGNSAPEVGGTGGMILDA
ncbi:glycosyl hydrolase family 28-related protein [Streptomyces sp. L2]|uniref:glycosyl hydrolase family 28-related protein n=1 Tax=Streptomyces sp. L2 TaxID=2162665 RepID=UPI0010113471|nr:glycosyl hydrolase family 28-related protein [Streptomyces sp. L2]